MTYKKFERLFNHAVEFMNDLKKLEDVLEVLSPGGTCVVEFGGHFLDRYTSLLSAYVGDEADWISWYMWDNDMGKNGLEVSWGDKKMRVESLEDLWYIINKKELK